MDCEYVQLRGIFWSCLVRRPVKMVLHQTPDAGKPIHQWGWRTDLWHWEVWMDATVRYVYRPLAL